MDFIHTIGHAKQKELFERAMKNGRMGHAYAFVGPANVGKTTFALDLASALGADPIQDVIIAEELSTDSIRRSQARLNLTPVGRLKVMIVPQAEAMTPAVGNLILKTLEEPPPHSLIILLTENYYGLLPTVVSRVQRVNLFPLSKVDMARAIERFSLPAEKAEAIVKLAAGRPGLARRLAEETELLGFYDSANRLLPLIYAGDSLSRLRAADELSKSEEQQLKIFLTCAMSDWVNRPHHEPAIAGKLLAAWRDLRYHLNKKLVLDNLFLP